MTPTWLRIACGRIGFFLGAFVVAAVCNMLGMMAGHNLQFLGAAGVMVYAQGMHRLYPNLWAAPVQRVTNACDRGIDHLLHAIQMVMASKWRQMVEGLGILVGAWSLFYLYSFLLIGVQVSGGSVPGLQPLALTQLHRLLMAIALLISIAGVCRMVRGLGSVVYSVRSTKD